MTERIISGTFEYNYSLNIGDFVGVCFMKI